LKWKDNIEMYLRGIGRPKEDVSSRHTARTAQRVSCLQAGRP